MARCFQHALTSVLVVTYAHAALPPGTLPPWPASYKMKDSTIVQPCNNGGANGGFLNASYFATFGVVDVDWSNGKAVWKNAKPQNCEESLEQQVAQIHAVDPTTKVMTYKNLVKALPWMTPVREKMEDPSYWGFFLKWKNPNYSNASVALYHDFEQTEPGDCGKGITCGEYLWDHRNGSMLTEFLVNTYATNPPGVAGFFIDDDWSAKGPSEENASAVRDMGLTPQDVTAITAGWSANMAAVQTRLLSTGGFTWQSLWNVGGWDFKSPQKGCAAFLRTNCGAGSPTQSNPMFFAEAGNPVSPGPVPIAYPEQDLAAFLLVRGPYAWIGTGWIGCLRVPPVPGQGREFGEPNGFCSETSADSGIFTRDFSLATVTLDCNTFNATIAMK